MSDTYKKFDFLSPKNVVKITNDVLYSFASNLQKVYCHDLSTEFPNQILSLKAVFTDNLSKLNSIKELGDFLLIKNKCTASSLPNVCNAILLFLTLPVTVAGAERSFSKLKLIKNYLRCTMSEERLSDLSLDLDFFWNGDKPQLTTCFQQSVLTTIPFALLLLLYCFQWLFSDDQDLSCERKNPCTTLYAAKLFFSIVLIGNVTLEFIYLVSLNGVDWVLIPLIDFYSAIIRLIGLITVLVIQVRQHRAGILNSKIIFCFWFAASICEFFRPPIFHLITDNLDQNMNSYVFILGCIAFSVYVSQLFLAIFTDPEYDCLYHFEKDDYIIAHQPVLSRLFFSWINRLILFGYKNNIKLKHLDRLSPDLKSITQVKMFQKWWQKQLNKHQIKLYKSKEDCPIIKPQKGNASKPSLGFAIARMMVKPFFIATLLEISYDFLSLVPALLLDSLIGFVGDLNEPVWHGVAYAFGLFVASAASSLLMTHDLFFLFLASFMIKAGLPAAIYRKSLKMSSAAKRDYTIGELCNLISVDTQKLTQLLLGVNLVWSGPLRVFLTLTLLWQYLGVACLAGVAVLLLIIPITVFIASRTHHYQSAQMKRKDSRLRQMNEILNGIKVLKLFAWEVPFMDQISEIRKQEIITIKRLAILNALVVFLWGMAPFLVAITSFVTFVLMDENNVLDPSIAFVSLTLFNHLRNAMSIFPDVIAEIVQSRISLQRLRKFFLCDEINEESIERTVPEGKAVVMERASFAWTSAEGEEPFLRDISAEIPVGALVGVVGQVGSGKSAFLAGLLGEMHITTGKVNVCQGAIAYVAQQAWIQNATVQDNVLFLKTMDDAKYKDVFEKCCLKDDLLILPHGDQTEIGEKGINLSGGQKQRVSLARALYQDSDMYLLDDPLSAVDSHVGAHIFSQVIGPKGALRNKTRILVTHDLSVLPEMDIIFVMADGKIMEKGSYQELMDKGGEFSKFVEKHLKTIKENEDDNGDGDENAQEDINNDTSENTQKKQQVAGTLSPAELKEQMKKTGSRISRTLSKVEPTVLMQKQKSKTKLIEKEKMEEGRVKASVFMSYFRSANIWLISLVVVCFAAYQGFEVGSNIWLSEWSTDDSSDIKMRNLRIGIYGFLGLGQGLSILSAAFLLAIALTRASRILHSQMLISVLRSPMAFFERTPVGRILNRFGKDIDMVDTNFPLVLNKLISGIMVVIATAIVISLGNPLLLVALLPFGLYYWLVQAFNVSTSRQTRRLQAVSFSPIMSNFSETIQGASTIRALCAQETFIEREDLFLDISNQSSFACTMLNRWFSVWLHLGTNFLVLMVALFTVFQRSNVGPGVAGLTLSYSLNVSLAMTILVRYFTYFEIHMISVERIVEYSELPSEAPWKLEHKKHHLPNDWPSEGTISFEDYQLKYQKSTNPALRGINVNILPGEKVGIVGRTGAGKSSLTVGLFRIVEPCGGCIRIDGVDIASLGLHDVRGKQTIIPQDPVLFSGTLRLNLDPLNKHPDDKLWEALDHAHLKNFVSSLGSGLEYQISEGGENMSVGQRQQLCLARALLKKTKILVLDEATAAVDMKTDRLIQETIRREFDDCTVLTIAHRLYTILDYDRIIVMDDGKIAEEGKPDFLLQNENSMFSQLARDAGLL